MSSNNCDRSRAARARGFAVLFAVLALGLGLLASPTKAAPFAYAPNFLGGNVSVIDTANNTVVATVTVGGGPAGVAVTPDGKNAYVANSFSSNVSVIDTSNTVVATVGVGLTLLWVALTPDGKHAYVTNGFSDTVSVIETTGNTVVATVGVGTNPLWGSRHPGWETRLRDESGRHRLSDRDDRQHRGGHGRGGG
jgi:YVTN family beta-propeller protein